MLTKGIIQSIDFNSNTCIVRIPLFETAGNKYKNEATAIFAIPPGIFNGYKVNDVVIIGFDSGEIGEPVVVGKLYTDAATEAKVVGGAGHFNDLVISNSAVLPADVEISFTQDSENKAITSEVALSNYKSLTDIVNAIIKNSSNINKINESISNLDITGTSKFSTDEQEAGTWIDNKTIYKKTITYDFVTNNIGQVQNTAWSTEIDISSLNFDIISEVSDFTFITTSTGTVSNGYFDSYINTATKKIEISGETGEYTLSKFYITLQYTKQ